MARIKEESLPWLIVLFLPEFWPRGPIAAILQLQEKQQGLFEKINMLQRYQGIIVAYHSNAAA
jgi:hypothetical protein